MRLQWLMVVALVGFAVLPVFVRDPVVTRVLVLTFLYAYLGQCWNLVGGYAGQPSMGHSVFFGIGAYASTLLYLRQGLSPWLGLLPSCVLAGMAGFVVAYPTLRIRGHFYALATLAISEVAVRLALSLRGLTNGAIGLSLPPIDDPASFLFKASLPYYYIALAFLAGATSVAVALEHTRFGLRLLALREDEEATANLGVNVSRHKVLIAVISAALTGMGGTVYAQYVQFIDPNSVLSFQVSVEILIVAIVGGVAVSFGPLLGALLYIPSSALLTATLGGRYPGVHLLLFGILLIGLVLFQPDGIGGFLREWIRRKRVGSSGIHVDAVSNT